MTPVDKPGIYTIDIDQYHSQRCCFGPSISSSGLRTIARECPARFYATSDLNPHRFEDEDKKALSFGRAAHALVLGEPEFYSKFVLSPFDEFRSKEAREWRDKQKKQIVRPDEWTTIQAMTAAQRASPEAMQAFTAGKPEQSVIAIDPTTGIYIKTRPDWLPDNPKERFICEYKTAVSIKPQKLSRDVFDYGYEMQAAMALDVVASVMGVVPLGMAHVVQEKDPPYLCEVRLFTLEQIQYGRLQYKRALRIFARCLKQNQWPGYSREPLYFETPYYIVKAMEDFNDNGSASDDAFA